MPSKLKKIGMIFYSWQEKQNHSKILLFNKIRVNGFYQKYSSFSLHILTQNPFLLNSKSATNTSFF